MGGPHKRKGQTFNEEIWALKVMDDIEEFSQMISNDHLVTKCTKWPNKDHLLEYKGVSTPLHIQVCQIFSSTRETIFPFPLRN